MLKNFKVLSLTDAAADRIKAIIADADKPIAGLRVGVKNGGCAGMSYTMEYAEGRNPGEDMVEDRGVTVFVDPKAVLFLLGTRDGLQDDQAVVPVRVQQPEPDLVLRLRRIRRDHAGQS